MRNRPENFHGKLSPHAAATTLSTTMDLGGRVELPPELEAMLRILHELFAPKYVSFSRPFTDGGEATALGIEPSLVGVRARLVSGGFSGPGEFAASVRDVFANCYLLHGHPDKSTISKACARLDSVFEQNINVLPRNWRDAASLFAAPNTLCGPPEEKKTDADADSGRRKSGRQQAQVRGDLDAAARRDAQAGHPLIACS